MLPITIFNFFPSRKVYHAGFETDVDLTDDMILEDKALLKVVQDEQQFR